MLEMDAENILLDVLFSFCFNHMVNSDGHRSMKILILLVKFAEALHLNRTT